MYVYEFLISIFFFSCNKQYGTQMILDSEKKNKNKNKNKHACLWWFLSTENEIMR